MCLGSGNGWPQAYAAASAPAPGRGPWDRACFVPPERARGGASLGPGAGWQAAPKQGRWARGVVHTEVEVWPGVQSWAVLFLLSVLCTLGDTAILGLLPLRPHPELRLKTPPSVVTHWLMGDGGPRREGPVAAVLETQVWRAPGSPQMRNRNFYRGL